MHYIINDKFEHIFLHFLKIIKIDVDEVLKKIVKFMIIITFIGVIFIAGIYLYAKNDSQIRY